MPKSMSRHIPAVPPGAKASKVAEIRHAGIGRSDQPLFRNNRKIGLGDSVVGRIYCRKNDGSQGRHCRLRLLELPVSNDLSIRESVDLLAVVPSQIPSLLADTDAPDL